ncbi:hypothetical protein MPOCJGCO_4234 [Methylobacterium trifolii]|uniref:Uncharacterized protein n=1 Tax=Methylobacterium trifolii TaxID=1003092 RepID=A0ABQ4U5B7_9HYPH|nr:hypothetical protein MPOCJGCO_4234 [Methylobacterium trifolii]
MIAGLFGPAFAGPECAYWFAFDLTVHGTGKYVDEQEGFAMTVRNCFRAGWEADLSRCKAVSWYVWECLPDQGSQSFSRCRRRKHAPCCDPGPNDRCD